MDFASHSVLMGLHSSLQERASFTASVFQSSGSSADLSASLHQLIISKCVLEAVVASHILFASASYFAAQPISEKLELSQG